MSFTALLLTHLPLFLKEEEKTVLVPYVGKEITLGVRPENIVPGTGITLSVISNENLGQTTLVHGTIGNQKTTAKLREWSNYKQGDQVSVDFDRVHFFDKETTNAIK